jgi:hypothetical protein
MGDREKKQETTITPQPDAENKKEELTGGAVEKDLGRRGLCARRPNGEGTGHSHH